MGLDIIPEQKPGRDVQQNIMIGDLGESIVKKAFGSLNLRPTHNPTRRKNGQFVMSVDFIDHNDDRDDMVEVKNYPSQYAIDETNFYTHLQTRWDSHEDENPKKDCTRNAVLMGPPQTEELEEAIESVGATAAFVPAVDKPTNKNDIRQTTEFIADYVRTVVKNGNRQKSIHDYNEWLVQRKGRSRLPVNRIIHSHLYHMYNNGLEGCNEGGRTVDSDNTIDTTVDSCAVDGSWRFSGS